MNTIANRSGSTAVASLQSLKSGLQNVQATLPVSGGEDLLRMQTDGSWVYGAENIDVEPGSLWAVNPMSIKHGFSCWTNYPAKMRKKNELLGERMVAMTAPKPDVNSLPSYDDGAGGEWEWKDQVSMQLVCLSGEDRGTQVLYKTSSVGGTRAVNNLLDAIVAELNKGSNAVVPHVELNNDHYDHKTYGKTYVPVFEAVDWSEMSDELPEVGDDAAPQAAPAKQVEQPKAAEPAAAPQRRRRAAAAEAPQSAEPADDAALFDEVAAAEQQAAPARAAAEPRRRRRVA